MMHQKTVSRRTFLRLGGAIAGTGILAACAPGPPPQASGPDMTMAEPVTIRYGRHDPAAGVQTTLDAFHEEYSMPKSQPWPQPAPCLMLSAVGRLWPSI